MLQDGKVRGIRLVKHSCILVKGEELGGAASLAVFLELVNPDC